MLSGSSCVLTIRVFVLVPCCPLERVKEEKKIPNLLGELCELALRLEGRGLLERLPLPRDEPVFLRRVPRESLCAAASRRRGLWTLTSTSSSSSSGR